MSNQITVTVEGGAVQDVLGVPEGYTVKIKDYDIDTRDEEEIAECETDDEGEQYYPRVIHPTNGQSHPGEITKVQPTARRWRVKETPTALGISRDIVQEEQFNGQDVLVNLRSAENAPLVAAAPALLAAIEAHYRVYGDMATYCDDVKRGLRDGAGLLDLRDKALNAYNAARAAIAKATNK